ncbi:hypothetical protein EDI_167550 [Entamoeba dispar SAW760]|uniref:Uncharacterized protein n=1 Tax=Entamoeba dispar (strain ATCC PRA-260 / SAW760) TaxID=370354 RepID=B0EP31_ENTDS|nr:uncharacterized protein EDI_167550 [Entamoeba dispar SAW760]EDR23706.1 hypothetical protein EDI_167550 [Entamoeba dispar SAW760]|eukprot:EDR23706.1 hypothetical protein EDI_167550 [Entamoeba dispar SAW760]
MNSLTVIFCFFVYLSNANYTVFSNGTFRNNWYEKESSCYASQTGQYNGQYILYTQMARDKFLNLYSDTPIKDYNYLTFAVNWEDQYCNLRIGVELGTDKCLTAFNFKPDVLEPQKWNRVVVDISSLNSKDINTIRINKNDLRDTNIMFNDFMFTNEPLPAGVFEYPKVQTSSEESKLEDSSVLIIMTLTVTLLIAFF